MQTTMPFKFIFIVEKIKLITWTSCLIPLAATRPGSCLMVGWADPEDIAAEARVARGSTNRTGNTVPSQHTGSTISTLYYFNIVLSH